MSIHSSAGTYPVQLRPQAGAWLAHACIDACRPDKLAVITDTTVAHLHADPLVAALRATGRPVSVHTFAPGEDSKVLDTLATLYDELLDAGLSRRSALVALGGGVVGDITGFAAATYMRGIPYVQVPTTTLAAVDSSVGGKTGVNTARGKNLVGAFYPPRAVLLAASHLATQTPRAHAAGLVESLKMAAAYDAELFHHIVAQAEALLEFDPALLLDVLHRSIAIKAGVVSRDEREAGERAVLNLGHTIGHAIETGEAYRLQHGECVGLGMLAEMAWAVEAGHSSAAVVEATEAALLALKMPTEWRRVKLDVEAMGLDKKRVGADVTLTLVPTLGQFELRAVPLRSLADFASRN